SSKQSERLDKAQQECQHHLSATSVIQDSINLTNELNKSDKTPNFHYEESDDDKSEDSDIKLSVNNYPTHLNKEYLLNIQ
ncbi:5925_t:CDS:2, partial [Racocetra persica]